jgi:hypothetical protein
VFLWDRWENRLCLVSVDAPARIICDPRTLWVRAAARATRGRRHEPCRALIERLFAAEVAFLHALARSAALTDAEALHDLRLSLRHLRGLLWPLRGRRPG